MDGFPVLDYAPSTLLGLGVLMVFFGLLVPYRVVKVYLARIASLESALAKMQDALAEEQKTTSVIRRVFQSLEEGAK